MQQRPKAYLFDVFGTVVNWRYSLAKGLEAAARKVVVEGTSSGVDAAVLERARGMTFSDWEWFAFQWFVFLPNYNLHSFCLAIIFFFLV